MVVGRILTLSIWLAALFADVRAWRPWSWRTYFPRRLIARAVSWRIQAATDSPWNHVACYLGGGWVAEAEWNRGVCETELLAEYCTGAYRVAVIRPPANVDRAIAVERWRAAAAAATAKGRQAYSLSMLFLMRFAALCVGPAGIRKVVRNNPDDDAWICSELGAFGWCQGEIAAAARDLLVTPTDFIDIAVGKQLGLEQLVLADPCSLVLED